MPINCRPRRLELGPPTRFGVPNKNVKERWMRVGLPFMSYSSTYVRYALRQDGTVDRLRCHSLLLRRFSLRNEQTPTFKKSRAEWVLACPSNIAGEESRTLQAWVRQYLSFGCLVCTALSTGSYSYAQQKPFRIRTCIPLVVVVPVPVVVGSVLQDTGSYGRLLRASVIED